MLYLFFLYSVVIIVGTVAVAPSGAIACYEGVGEKESREGLDGADGEGVGGTRCSDLVEAVAQQGCGEGLVVGEAAPRRPVEVCGGEAIGAERSGDPAVVSGGVGEGRQKGVCDTVECGVGGSGAAVGIEVQGQRHGGREDGVAEVGGGGACDGIPQVVVGSEGGKRPRGDVVEGGDGCVVGEQVVAQLQLSALGHEGPSTVVLGGVVGDEGAVEEGEDAVAGV